MAYLPSFLSILFLKPASKINGVTKISLYFYFINKRVLSIFNVWHILESERDSKMSYVEIRSGITMKGQ
jgi:hypothetical protein